jgi:hypothetical protein
MKSFLKLSLAGLVLASLSMAAQATQPGNNGGGNGGCGVGQQTNGCGGTTPAPAPINNGGAGGAGGQGGAGGTGIGVGIAAAQASAAAVAAASSSANATANQVQGQQQGQTQSSRNTATGGAGGKANATGGNATGGNAAGGAGGNSGGNVITVEGAKGDVYMAPAQERNPVNTAYAAPVVATNGTCMGSSSGGGQGAAIGISFATTWTDNSCDIRYDAEALRAAGLTRAAQARLCQKADIAKAMEAAGTPCPGAEAKRAESILNGTQSAAAYQQVTTASIPTLLP